MVREIALVRAIDDARREQILIKQSRALRRQLEHTLGTVVRDAIRTEYRKIVSDWKGKPRFAHAIRIRPNKIILHVWPVQREHMGKVFEWVDKGTGLEGPTHSRYWIRPIRAKRLRFRPFYLARTRPIARAHVGPGTAIGLPVFAKEVHHPGIQARHFSRKIAEDYRRQFAIAVETDLRRAIRRVRKTGRV